MSCFETATHDTPSPSFSLFSFKAKHSAEIGQPKTVCMSSLLTCFQDHWSRRTWSSYYAAVNTSQVKSVTLLYWIFLRAELPFFLACDIVCYIAAMESRMAQCSATSSSGLTNLPNSEIYIPRGIPYTEVYAVAQKQQESSSVSLPMAHIKANPGNMVCVYVIIFAPEYSFLPKTTGAWHFLPTSKAYRSGRQSQTQCPGKGVKSPPSSYSVRTRGERAWHAPILNAYYIADISRPRDFSLQSHRVALC